MKRADRQKTIRPFVITKFYQWVSTHGGVNHQNIDHEKRGYTCNEFYPHRSWVVNFNARIVGRSRTACKGLPWLYHNENH